MDVDAPKERAPVVDLPPRVAVDEGLLVLEDDDAALGDKEGQLRACTGVELGEVDAVGDLGAHVGRDVLDGGTLEEGTRRRVLERLVARVDVLERLERRKLERGVPFKEEVGVLVARRLRAALLLLAGRRRLRRLFARELELADLVERVGDGLRDGG